MHSGMAGSGTPASTLVHSSAGLFAVFHALLRLLAPRHPPYALSSLAALILPSPTRLPAKVSPFGVGYACQEQNLSSSHRRPGCTPACGSNDPILSRLVF